VSKVLTITGAAFIAVGAAVFDYAVYSDIGWRGVVVPISLELLLAGYGIVLRRYF
jgi:hypothetical protein